MDVQKISKALNDTGLFYMGVYGGINEESTLIDHKKMGLPRFFSFLSDDSLLSAVEQHFEVLEFDKVDINSKKEGFYYQSLILRKK